jgi:hypothetical protein
MNVERLRKDWERRGAETLSLKGRPPADLGRNGLPKAHAVRYRNVTRRLRHLARVLTVLHEIYMDNQSLYGDRFLEFVGNEVIRKWPWKDFAFESVSARKLAKGKRVSLLGSDFREVDKSTKAGLRYEHWTPISFFRDVFKMRTRISERDFYRMLCNHYRVVWITRAEDARLDKRHRANRSRETYSKFGITISSEKGLWAKSFSMKRR